MIRAGTPSLWMYYSHPQLENGMSDNGLLCVFWVWLSCFRFLGLSNCSDKETQKSVGTIASRALEISSHMKCSFLTLEMLSCAWSWCQAFLSPHLSNLSPLYVGWGGSSKLWLSLNVPKDFFFFQLFVCSCVSTFGPWTIPPYLKYPRVFSGFVTFFS